MSTRKQEQDEQDSFTEYLNDLNEWNEHQYDPGYWTGGKIPFAYKYGGKRLGVALVIIGILIIVPTLTDFSINMVIGLLTGIICIAGGVVRIRGKK